MKSIIIWGTARSGKSTFAQQIKKKYGHNWIEIDALRKFYDKIYPQDKIFEKEDFEQGKILASSLTSYIQELEYTTKNNGEYFIFEGVSLDLEYILSNLITKNNYIFICMAYPDISIEEKLNEIQKYETKYDWTYKYNENNKRVIVKNKLNESHVVQEIAKKLNLKFINTSNRKEGFKEAFKYIEENLI